MLVICVFVYVCHQSWFGWAGWFGACSNTASCYALRIISVVTLLLYIPVSFISADFMLCSSVGLWWCSCIRAAGLGWSVRVNVTSPHVCSQRQKWSRYFPFKAVWRDVLRQETHPSLDSNNCWRGETCHGENSGTQQKTNSKHAISLRWKDCGVLMFFGSYHGVHLKG